MPDFSRFRHVWQTAPVAVAAVTVLAVVTGCTGLQYRNTATMIERDIRASHDSVKMVMFKASILVPARDILTLDPLWRAIFGCEAWNVESGRVENSSFFTNRPASELTPERVAKGAGTEPPPQPPFQIKKAKTRHGRLRFIGTDALGRTFMFKLDHPDFPELGSTATIVASRIMWALGYNVPQIYLVRIEGTGDERFDGQRATAALYLENVAGHFHFDWFRYRRELRGLRLASAWLSDTDRVDTNTLVVVDDNRATYYLIDFDSSLGSWQGRPKKVWRGVRYAWDLFPLPPSPPPGVLSPALGRLPGDFDPSRWRPQTRNNAFNHMTDADAEWMANLIGKLDRAHLEAIVAEAKLSNPADAEMLVDLLMKRRAAILSRY